MPIQISSQPAILAWNTSRAQLKQSGNASKTLQLESKAPLLEMKTKHPKILIDQSQSFADAGLKGIKAFMNEAVSYGYQIVSQGIARTVDQGNAFIDIHTGVDPIPDQAIYNAYDMFEKEFNYGTLPTTRPSITLDRGTVTTNFNRGTVNNRTISQKIQLEYTPWQVDYYMKQYSNIEFRYEPSQLKLSV